MTNEKLKAWRYNAGLTMGEAADRAKVSRAQWFKWEVHGVIPHPRNARHAAQVMGGVVTDFWDLGGES